MRPCRERDTHASAASLGSALSSICGGGQPGSVRNHAQDLWSVSDTNQLPEFLTREGKRNVLGTPRTLGQSPPTGSKGHPNERRRNAAMVQRHLVS